MLHFRLTAASWRAALGCAVCLFLALPAWAQDDEEGDDEESKPPPARPTRPTGKNPEPPEPKPLPGTVDKPLPKDTEKIAKALGTPYKPQPLGTMVKFNLQDADLAELVNHISGMTGKRFIYGAKLRKIEATVVSPTPVTLAEAYEAFLAILDANGMTVVPHGRFLKIVETRGIARESTPIRGRGVPMAASDSYVTRLYRLRNADVDEVAKLLVRFKSKEGDIATFGNLLIMTDTSRKIRQMLRIIEEVDVGSAGSRMWIEPIYYGNAEDLAEQIKDVYGIDGKNGSVGGLEKVIADENTNSLIIIGNEDGYDKLLSLVKRVDIKPIEAGKVHVLRLQHAVAEDLAKTLNQMLQRGSQGASGGGRRGRPGHTPPPPSVSTDIFEGDVNVVPDQATNALVITSSARDYAQLRLVIERLDQPRRQVFIEAVIMDVSIERTSDLGLRYHGGSTFGEASDGIVYGGLNPLESILLPSADQLQGLALGVRGPGLEGSTNLLGTGITVPAFGVVLNALATSGDANVLATPHILATDNVTAEINIGENIPLQTNLAGGGLGNLAGLAGQAGGNNANLGALALGGLGFNAPRADVGTKIKVTPHINQADEVRLEIEEEISERGASSGSLGAVSITQRTANTTLVVQDQETVVIGGLMRDSEVNSKSKVPILGDLPVLGFLFRRSQTEKRKTNLILVMTPYVIREQADLRKIFERKMQQRQEFLDRYFVFSGQDWTPPKDFSRTNGLVEQIRQSYMRVEERFRLEEASRQTEVRTHEASEPLEMPVIRRRNKSSSPPRPTPPRRPNRGKKKGAMEGDEGTRVVEAPALNLPRMARSVNVEQVE